jgi:hypothetical protein
MEEMDLPLPAVVVAVAVVVQPALEELVLLAQEEMEAQDKVHLFLALPLATLVVAAVVVALQVVRPRMVVGLGQHNLEILQPQAQPIREVEAERVTLIRLARRAVQE